MDRIYHLTDELTRLATAESLRIAADTERPLTERARACALLAHLTDAAGFDEALERQVATLCFACLHEPTLAVPLIRALLANAKPEATRLRIGVQLMQRAIAGNFHTVLVEIAAHTVSSRAWRPLLEDAWVRCAAEAGLAIGSIDRTAFMLSIWRASHPPALAWIRSLLQAHPALTVSTWTDHTLLVLAPTLEAVRVWADRALSGQYVGFHAWRKLDGDGDEIQHVLQHAIETEHDTDRRQQLGRWLSDVQRESLLGTI